MQKWIPNILTGLNLCLGVIAIILVDPLWSPVSILIAGICDLLDGYSARELGVSSAIGKELDSFADLISFGLAPVYVLYSLIEVSLPLSTLLVISGTLFAAIRLARFNTMPSSKPYFIGLPTPAFGLFVTGLILTSIPGMNFPVYLYLWISIIAAILMVTKFTFPSFKSLRLAGVSNLPLYLGFLSFAITIFIRLELALFIGMSGYITSSIIFHYFNKLPADN